MNFRGRILVALSVVGCVPLALLGWQSFAINHRELEHAIGAAQSGLAQAAAQGAEQWVAHTTEEMRLAVQVLPYAQLSADELGAVLRIPFRQLKAAVVLVVLDEQGHAVAPLLRAGPQLAPERGTISEADLDDLSRRIPLAAAIAAGVALGQPWRAHAAAWLPVALRVSENPVRVVAGQLSLAELEEQLRRVTPAGHGAFLLGPEGRLIASASGEEPAPSVQQLALQSAASGAATRVQASGEEWLAATAPLGDLGWTLVVAQPAREAFHAADLVRLYTVFWVGVALVLTLLLGLLLSRELANPIRELSAAARALSEGRYDQRVAQQTDDELGQFAVAFNHMSDELLRRDQEIRAWNSELQKRVDERTAELAQAQDQILRTRRLAALGSLGAGVAHELNNPVTSVLGIARLLQRELGDDPRHQDLLNKLGEQALRISKVAGDLRKFSEQERASAGQRFALGQTAQAALELQRAACAAQNIRVHAAIAPALPEIEGDPLQLKEAIAQLLQNAVQAMPRGGDLTLRLDGVGRDALKLSISDTGAGVPEPIRERIFDPFFTTKQGVVGAGLGLSIAHSIVKAHHGELALDKTPPPGATFTVVLPAAAASANLT